MSKTPINKMMFLLISFMFLLPSIYVQETGVHEHMDNSAKHESVSVIPEKHFVTSSYENKLKHSDSDTDNVGVNVNDKPVHHGHDAHDHDNPNKHHGSHTFHDHDLSHSDHSMDNHDMHAHHDHSLHSTNHKDGANDSQEHHEMLNKNNDSDYELLLQDQPAQDSNDLQKNDNKQTDKNYDVDHAKHYKDNSLHDHLHHHDDHHNMDNNMDPNDMTHHMHMNMNDSDHGMMMYFQTGIDAIVLFKEWKITTVAELIGSMIGIMILGTFYEALKYLREHLFRQYVSSMQFSTVAVTGESGRVTEVHKVESHRILSWAHAIQTCLHVVQIVTSYFLMLIFMTYNVWLCIAVVIGSAIGYFIFGWKKATVVDITEHCH